MNSGRLRLRHKKLTYPVLEALGMGGSDMYSQPLCAAGRPEI
jgi:hypothetical protein